MHTSIVIIISDHEWSHALSSVQKNEVMDTSSDFGCNEFPSMDGWALP